MTVSAEILVVGLMTGLAYAVLAAGLVLIYRATRVINFAHGEIGAFGAAVLALLVLDHDWNFFVALALVLVIGGAVGAAVELGVIRRLFHAPRLIVLVATIGIAQLLFFAQAVLPGVENLSRYPSPIDRTIEVGTLLLRSEHFMVLAFVPACIAGLTIFLTRTPYGLGVRAAAENGDAARLAGISVKRVSTLVWVLAAVLATLSAVLLNPMRGGIVGGAMGAALGPGLLLRALAAGLIGRLTSLPMTLVGGVLIGVVEALLIVNVAAPGAADLAVFALVLGLVLLHRQGAADEDRGSWSLTPKVAPIPERLRSVWWVRRLPLLGGGAAVALAVVVPLLLTTSAQLFLLSQVLVYAIIALSLTVLIGWAGQLSLGQFAFVGLGAMTTAALYGRGMSFLVAVAYGTVAGVVAALAIGAPALRVRGLHLAITTLGFAVMARGWLFTQDVFLSEGSVVTVPRGTIGPVDLAAPRTYYYLCLTALVVCVLMVSRLRSSGVGRTLIAVRDNAPSAAAFTVSPTTAKLTAFAVSGALAAFAGGLLAGLRVQFGAEAFGVSESLRVVAMTVIGGLGSVAGSVMGAVYVVGAPAVFQGSQAAALLTSGIGLLVLLLYFPGGLAQLLYQLRDSLLALADRRLAATGDTGGASARGVAPPAAAPPAAAPVVVPRPSASPPDDLRRPALAAIDVSVRFGGRLALDGVSVRAEHGEVVGLIGSNGAGKSTLMNVVSGFLRPETGRIRLHDQDITPLLPHERARAGLGRVFQDARLFGDLTVTEAVKVALEGRQRSETVPSMLWLPPARRAERAKTAQAAELIAFLGLGRYADTFISSLSTGTRRIAELACLLALQPRVILLDEPTAGVAQRETEAFGPLLGRIATELSATLVVIEHDMPLIMSISDRVYCLAAGRVIASGRPAAVRDDPAVVAAYLGTDERAIERSDAAVPAGGGA
jgi:ABC-type branched-subunit amino acid transport system ATPase component/ABC-type branched-subunit amino acid transport system permease subunit